MKFNFDNDLNKSVKRFDYEITEKHEYRKLEELYNENKDEVHIVRMFYTNKKSMYGDNEVVVTDDYSVNLPKHLTEIVNKLITDEKYLDLISKGQFGFKVYSYEYGENKRAYSVNWGVLDSRNEHR